MAMDIYNEATSWIVSIRVWRRHSAIRIAARRWVGKIFCGISEKFGEIREKFRETATDKLQSHNCNR